MPAIFSRIPSNETPLGHTNLTKDLQRIREAIGGDYGLSGYTLRLLHTVFGTANDSTAMVEYG